jgi:hypothetical protein
MRSGAKWFEIQVLVAEEPAAFIIWGKYNYKSGKAVFNF